MLWELCCSQRHIRYRPFSHNTFWLVTAWKAQVYIITLTTAVFHFRFQLTIPVSQYSHLRGRGPETPINEMQPWLMLLVTPVSDKSECQLWERSIVLRETPIFKKDQQILEANGRVTKAETESAVATKPGSKSAVKPNYWFCHLMD